MRKRQRIPPTDDWQQLELLLETPGRRSYEVIRTVETLQRNPALGEYRIAVALKQLGIELSPRTCDRILALNRKLYGLPKPAKALRDPQPMPFAAQYRHHVWSVDVRYLDHGLGDLKVYCLAILENYSRAVLASDLSLSQDLGAYLRVLRQAVEQYGAPAMLVSDGGGIFRATQAKRIYAALGIQKAEIARRQPWQNYIETMLNVQRRMADWNFARARTWEELVSSHDQWVTDYNTQEHRAHQKREDGRRSPAAVLDWVRGRPVSAEDLERAFAPVHIPAAWTGRATFGSGTGGCTANAGWPARRWRCG